MASNPDMDRLYTDRDYYLDVARRSVEGMNRMPFVGPQGDAGGMNTGQTGYADIAFNPLLVLEQFYPTQLQGWQDRMRDPLEGQRLFEEATRAAAQGRAGAEGDGGTGMPMGGFLTPGMWG